MRFAAVMFDMDGTLLDSRDYWLAVVREASAHFGGRTIDREEFLSTFGQATVDDVKQFFPSASVEAVNAFYDSALPRHAQRISVMDGARELLAELAAAGVPRACVTNSPRRFTEDVFAHLRMRDLFTALACADEVADPKPAPDLVLLAARRMEVAVRDCVLVGDSRFDVAAGRAAGVFTIGLGVDADRRVESFAEVRALLD